MVGTASHWAHSALDPNTHLLPAIRSLYPAFTEYFRNTKTLTNVATYKAYYADADPMHSAIAFCGVVSFYVWIMEKITGNASQVDGLWTFLPLIYSLHFTVHKYFTYQPAKLTLFGGVEHASVWDKIEPRLALMSLLSIMWCVRLTYNAYRRGMFKPGEEDYRWPLLRKTMSRPVWEIFSIFFIAIAQNILLAITALPNYLLLTTTSVKHVTEPVPRPVNKLIPGDYVLAALFVANLTVQFYADQQQWNYQNYKRGKDPQEKPIPNAMVDPVTKLPLQKQNVMPYSTPEDAQRGFVTRGLWAWSRHPNFACEQNTWWILYAFVPLTSSPVSIRTRQRIRLRKHQLYLGDEQTSSIVELFTEFADGRIFVLDHASMAASDFVCLHLWFDSSSSAISGFFLSDLAVGVRWAAVSCARQLLYVCGRVQRRRERWKGGRRDGGVWVLVQNVVRRMLGLTVARIGGVVDFGTRTKLVRIGLQSGRPTPN